jgi:hypothetical protein
MTEKIRNATCHVYRTHRYTFEYIVKEKQIDQLSIYSSVGSLLCCIEGREVSALVELFLDPDSVGN